MKISNFSSKGGQFPISNAISPLLVIAFAVILRVVPHPANVAPIAAMALFGGAYLDKRYTLAVPLIAMLLSDLVIGFHNTMPFVYGSFVIIGLIGLWLRNHKTLVNTIGATLISSSLFFLITNLGVWLVGGLYPKTLQGLLNAYFYAIPFFRNTIVGDLFYVGLFFGAYQLILKVLNSKHEIRTSKQYQNTKSPNAKHRPF